LLVTTRSCSEVRCNVGRWLKPARQFVERNARALTAIPVWLFSSGPLGPPANLVPTGEPADVTELVKLTGALGHRVFAGRLEREQSRLIDPIRS
jgi:menaquinone-dependent protoporphyrinogen oxidase